MLIKWYFGVNEFLVELSIILSYFHECIFSIHNLTAFLVQVLIKWRHLLLQPLLKLAQIGHLLF